MLFALYSKTSQTQSVLILISDFSIAEKETITDEVSLAFLILPELLTQQLNDLFLQSFIYSLTL